MGSRRFWLSAIILAALAAPDSVLAAGDGKNREEDTARQQSVPRLPKTGSENATSLKSRPGIRQIRPPYASFGGRDAEATDAARTRTPARLRNRGRGEICCRVKGRTGRLTIIRTTRAGCRKRQGHAVEFRQCLRKSADGPIQLNNSRVCPGKTGQTDQAFCRP